MDPSLYNSTPMDLLNVKEHVHVVYLAQPALLQFALIAFAPVLFDTDAVVLAVALPLAPDTICLSHSVDSSALSLHSEESSVTFSRSISMEFDSEGSILSTCTEHYFEELQHVCKFET